MELSEETNVIHVAYRLLLETLKDIPALYDTEDADKIRPGNIQVFDDLDALKRVASSADLPGLVIKYGTFTPEKLLNSGGLAASMEMKVSYVTGSMKYESRCDDQLLAFAYLAETLRRNPVHIQNGDAQIFDCRLGPVSVSRAVFENTSTMIYGWKFDFTYMFQMAMSHEYLKGVADGNL